MPRHHLARIMSLCLFFTAVTTHTMDSDDDIPSTPTHTTMPKLSDISSPSSSTTASSASVSSFTSTATPVASQRHHPTLQSLIEQTTKNPKLLQLWTQPLPNREKTPKKHSTIYPRPQTSPVTQTIPDDVPPDETQEVLLFVPHYEESQETIRAWCELKALPSPEGMIELWKLIERGCTGRWNVYTGLTGTNNMHLYYRLDGDPFDLLSDLPRYIVLSIRQN